MNKVVFIQGEIMTREKANQAIEDYNKTVAHLHYSNQRKQQLADSGVVTPQEIVLAISQKDYMDNSIKRLRQALPSIRKNIQATRIRFQQDDMSDLEQLEQNKQSISINQDIAKHSSLAYSVFKSKKLTSTREKALDNLLKTRARALSPSGQENEDIVIEHLLNVNTQQLTDIIDDLTKSR